MEVRKDLWDFIAPTLPYFHSLILQETDTDNLQEQQSSP